MNDAILAVRCGTVPYEQAREAQLRLQGERQRDEIPDVLLLLEHPPVYTRGRRSTPDELPMGPGWYEMQGIEVRDTDRGGRVTYHGPGQLVAYPIVSLRPYGDDVHEYVRRLEQVMIGALAQHGVDAGLIDDLTGVWVGGRRAENGPMSPEIGPSTPGGARKIGSIGVHVSRGVTTHGLAVNVNNDLQPFEWVVPCGIEGCQVTSLSRELGAEQDLDAFADTVAARFGALYERDPVATDPADLGLDLPAATLRAQS
ncbi:MAG TPA: lipoyl(octanoyl) transferase LipB [Solirubrobacterales bacterium]|jgi:lipoyl(octanoyl) transferase|nr:lipoyl(octanoyl) transferase LipB [Solirubrobacterales bacterium]